MESNDNKIVIIGASLAGLSLALACAKYGLSVRLFERSTHRTSGGDSLSVHLESLANTTGHDPRNSPALTVVPAYRDRHLTTWPALYAWLHQRVDESARITLKRGKNLISAQDLGHCVQLNFADGTQGNADVVIGADGYSSSIRRVVAPEAANANYAGYIVWRGLVEESKLLQPIALSSDQGLWIDYVKGYRLVAAILPGRDGSLVIGRRQITFAWFEEGRRDLLEHKTCVTADGYVIGTLGRGNIDAEIRQELGARVKKVWPKVWAESVEFGVQSADALSGSPIAEYQPVRLAKGRLAIIGDAAHAVSPMTGSGFASSVEDAAVLSKLLAENATRGSFENALNQYELSRLPFANRLLGSSIRASSEFIRYSQAARYSS